MDYEESIRSFNDKLVESSISGQELFLFILSREQDFDKIWKKCSSSAEFIEELLLLLKSDLNEFHKLKSRWGG